LLIEAPFASSANYSPKYFRNSVRRWRIRPDPKRR
jgi:hypothetical protein